MQNKHVSQLMRGRIVRPKEIRDKSNSEEGSKIEVGLGKVGRTIHNAEKLTVKDIYGIAGKENVKIEEVEEALSFENDD